MKLLRAILVYLILLVNLVIAAPAFADAPKLDQNADYQQIAQTLTDLTASAK